MYISWYPYMSFYGHNKVIKVTYTVTLLGEVIVTVRQGFQRKCDFQIQCRCFCTAIWSSRTTLNYF